MICILYYVAADIDVPVGSKREDGTHITADLIFLDHENSHYGYIALKRRWRGR